MTVEQIGSLTDKIGDFLQTQGINEFHLLIPVDLPNSPSVASITRLHKPKESVFSSVSSSISEIVTAMLES
ncbi:hypothetical protein [Emticicia sp. W12TSBA100-4]|uniref:hypothetical protein n=1 Tax=Emticicia sp. W12TSBA100-4 TaxID=3160965 RepID=UPI003305C8C8